MLTLAATKASACADRLAYAVVMAKKKTGARRPGNPARRADAAAPLAPAAAHGVAAGSADPLGSLEALAGAERRVRVDLVDAVAGARAAGVSWQQIADALGVTRQSAHRRFSR